MLPLDGLDRFVADTRTAIFVRSADDLLMIRPDKTLGLNSTAAVLLENIYARNAAPVAQVVERLAPEMGVENERLLADAHHLLDTVRALLNEDFSPRRGLRLGAFDRSRVKFPTLAEIALTYGCQNRCVFCYASSPYREKERTPMTTEEVKRVMHKIFHQAHVPSLSFTGGEATLCKDLPELISYGREIGFRVNLITNGIRAADRAYARSLVEAGLDSAQVSLEAGDAETHDAIVGRPGAFEDTTAGIRNFRSLGIHVHTNTTLCSGNFDQGENLIRFVHHELNLQTLSMNMVIRTGEALGDAGMEVTYTEVAERLPDLLATARELGVRLVWYSPIPYCLFNPVLHDLGAKSCACIDGILSVDPTGQVLPCSSFGDGIGSLLEDDFDHIYSSRQARYWRNKEFVPPVCRRCPDVDVCAGACPLYWDASGTFDELPQHGSDDVRARARWEHRRQRGGSFGVSPTEQALLPVHSGNESHG
ncbi:MAG: radical SAM protein [Thermoanaerobaculales bacterium]|nr:radical SAM protein [Thermoanaerobaculales bacterium]